MTEKLELTPELRKLLIKHNKAIKRIVPTDRQVQLIRFIEQEKRVDSKRIADHFDISIHNANMQLLKLCNHELIRRENVGDPSGGNLYHYRPFDAEYAA